jgi:translation initiation factor 1A
MGGRKRHDAGSSKHERDNDDSLVFKGEDTGYGYVRACLGDGRFDVLCEDMESRMGIMRGTMRNRVWISAGAVVLYGTRAFQRDKVDIVHLYSKRDVCAMLKRRFITGGLYDVIACGQAEPCMAGGGMERHDSLIEFADLDDDSA